MLLSSLITDRVSKHEEAFNDIKAQSKSDMLPTEMAELFIAELKKEDRDGLPSLSTKSNEPKRISGRDAFHIHASYHTANGLEYQLLAAGFVTEKHLYVIRTSLIIPHGRDRGDFCSGRHATSVV